MMHHSKLLEVYAFCIGDTMCSEGFLLLLALVFQVFRFACGMYVVCVCVCICGDEEIV